MFNSLIMEYGFWYLLGFISPFVLVLGGFLLLVLYCMLDDWRMSRNMAKGNAERLAAAVALGLHK